MIEFEKLPTEYNPTWAYDPKAPILAEIRRGLLYSWLEPSTLRSVLEFPAVRILEVWAGIGPRLFFGRDDGPWVDYDSKLIDQNTRCPVDERAWPWCFGDEIIVYSSWDRQPLFVRFRPEDECELYLGTPGHSLAQSLQVEVQRTFNGKQYRVVPARDILLRQ